MGAAHREHLERMSAPLVAWLIDHGDVADNCGILDVTTRGRRFIRESVLVGSRAIRGAVPHPFPQEPRP
jgi:hypothetical protein